MSSPDRQAKTSTPLSQEQLKEMRTEIARIPSEFRTMYKVALAAGTAEAAQGVIEAIAASKGRKSEEESRKKQGEAERKRLESEEKTRRERKNAFDTLVSKIENKLQQTGNDNRFTEANNLISGATGKGKRLSEADQDIRELRTKISRERNEADARKKQEQENTEREKARIETGKLAGIITIAISEAEAEAMKLAPAENVDISIPLGFLYVADRDIDRVADINQYVDQSVIDRERGRISQAKERLNVIKAEKQAEYAESEQRNLVDTVKAKVESSRTKMAADPVGARSDLSDASRQITRVEKIRGVNTGLISEQRRLVEDQEKKISEKERENIVNGIINTHVLVATPDYEAAKTAADTALTAGRINESDRKKIIDLIDSERTRRVSPEAERIRNEMALPANANETELNRLEDEALAAYGNRQITQAEFNALNSEIQARRGVVTGRESSEKTKKGQEKTDKNTIMFEKLKRGDLLPAGSSYDLAAFDAEVAGRVVLGELTDKEGEDLKRLARQDYQNEEQRLKTDGNISQIITEFDRELNSIHSYGGTFDIDAKFRKYPSLTDREKAYIAKKLLETERMRGQAEADKGTDMSDIITDLNDEIADFEGSPEVKAALEAKLAIAKNMLDRSGGGGGLAEDIAEAKLNAAKAEKITLWVKQAIVLARYFSVPTLLLVGGGIGYFVAGNSILAGVLAAGSAAGGLSGGASLVNYLGFGGKADFAKAKVQFLEKERDILKIESELQDVPIAQAKDRAKFFAERYAAKNGIDSAKIPEIVKIWESRFGLERTKDLTNALNGIAQLT